MLAVAALLAACATPPRSVDPGGALLEGRLAVRVDGQPERDFSASFELAGSAERGSRARAEIWTDSERFRAMSADFRARLQRFSDAAGSGDSARLGQAYRELDLAGACDSCHAAFRQGASPAAPRTR